MGNIYGPGKGQTWLDHVVCNGNESRIESCDHSPWGVHDCSHSQDVSVSCATGKKLIATTQVRACANRVVIIKSSTAIWSIKYSVSHTRRVVRELVRECCTGDDASQWGNGKFDPLPRPNRLTDRH